MSSKLEIDSVIKSYGDNQILSDVYVKCETGDVVGVFGRNGTGKSTLLKILFGTLSAERKFIRIDNQVHKRAYATKYELCYLPQDGFLPKYMRVDKAVKLYLGKEYVEAFLNDDLLRFVASNKIRNLSGGELRYLEIKLLLKCNSKFVLLDEPFSGLSPIAIKTVKELIVENSKHKGIILTDHQYRNVLDVSNRNYLIYQGAVKLIKNNSEFVRWGYLRE